MERGQPNCNTLITVMNKRKKQAINIQVEAIDEWAHLPTIEDLFVHVWGRPNPSIDRTIYTTQEIHQAVDKLCPVEIEFCDRFNQDCASSDWGSTAYAGYYCGLAIIVWVKKGGNNPYDIYFDGERCRYATVSPKEGRKLIQNMLVLMSGNNVDWRSKA
jgi:hypothetical protein